MFPFSDPVITDNPKKMAWHSRKPEEEKQLFESLTKENRIGCLIEKKPDGKTHITTASRQYTYSLLFGMNTK